MDSKHLDTLREIFPNAQSLESNLSESDLGQLIEQSDLKDWPNCPPQGGNRPSSRLDIWTHERPRQGSHLELSITIFTETGYAEATALVRDADYRPPRPGQRKNKGQPKLRSEMSESDRERATRRARKMVRHKIKCINADRILTLNSRRYMYDQARIVPAFAEFNRLMKKRFPCWKYVAVAELHPKNKDHWHLHLAVNGFYDVNTVRFIWRQALRNTFKEARFDHTPGNIDISKKEGHKHSLNALARYLSKYLTKHADDGYQNKKRYFASNRIHPLKTVKLYIEDYNDLAIIRKVQEVTGGALARNPKWATYAGFDCLIMEMEPNST